MHVCQQELISQTLAAGILNLAGPFIMSQQCSVMQRMGFLANGIRSLAGKL